MFPQYKFSNFFFCYRCWEIRRVVTTKDKMFFCRMKSASSTELQCSRNEKAKEHDIFDAIPFVDMESIRVLEQESCDQLPLFDTRVYSEDVPNSTDQDSSIPQGNVQADSNESRPIMSKKPKLRRTKAIRSQQKLHGIVDIRSEAA